MEADVSLLKEKLHQILPKEKIGVEAAGDTVVLSGEVSGPVAQDTAISLAAPYAGGKKEKVVNLMHVGGVQQVMVEVRLAEIHRTVLDRMGINTTIVSPSGNFGVTNISGGFTVAADYQSSLTQPCSLAAVSTPRPAPSLTAMAGFKAGGLLWTMFFDVLKQNNLGRVLAEPNLVTTSGQEASFLAGGEYPSAGAPERGGGRHHHHHRLQEIRGELVFTPTVLDDGKIAMKVNPEVSELDFAIADDHQRLYNSGP